MLSLGLHRQVGPHDRRLGDLDLGYKIVAQIDQNKCIHCGLCYIACEDGAHQSITVRRMGEEEFASHAGNGGAQRVDYSGGVRFMSGVGDGYANIFEINQQTCVGCNLCSLVCPVTECISMLERPSPIPHLTWRQYQKELAQGKVR